MSEISQSNARLRIGFLASHGGSGMRAILAAIAAGEIDADAAVAISNNPGAEALDYAKSTGVPALCLNAVACGGPDGADAAIAVALKAHNVNLVVLSGYMRKLGPAVLAAYRGRILNIHPALLPAYGGHGMYGRRVHEAVAAAGEPESGATVHLVDGDYDTGPILAQARVALNPGDGVDEIEQKVRALEPGLYVETVRGIAEGRILLDQHAYYF